VETDARTHKASDPQLKNSLVSIPENFWNHIPTYPCSPSCSWHLKHVLCPAPLLKCCLYQVSKNTCIWKNGLVFIYVWDISVKNKC